MKGRVWLKNILDQGAGKDSLNRCSRGNNISQTGFLFKNDQGSYPPSGQLHDSGSHILHFAFAPHSTGFGDQLADLFAAAPQLFQYAPDLRGKEDKQHNNNGTGLQNGIQKPADGIQAQQLTDHRAYEQQSYAFEYLESPGILGEYDQLIQQKGHDHNVQQIIPAELSHTTAQGFN